MTTSRELRPLVVRFGAMGDMVLLTVLIRALYARFGQPVDLVSSGAWTRPLLEGQPGVGRVLVIWSRRTPYWLSAEQRRLVRQLRERGPGPVWLYESGGTKLSWLLERAGFPAGLISRAADFPFKAGEHFADRWLRFAASTPRDLHTAPPLVLAGAVPYSQLEVSAQARAQLDPWLRARGLEGRPLILVQAGNRRTTRIGLRRRASNTKYWPEDRWSAVLRGMRALHPQHALVLLGVPREARLNEEIMRKAAVTDLHNVADDLPIPRLLALAERATGMISVDSGPAHAAAAVGCSVVVLFGRAWIAQYAPRGPNAIVRSLAGLVDGEQSMLGISAEQVLATWQELMTVTRGRPTAIR
jgi:heptosyltransferase-2/heptosyltransferase-3